MPGRWRSTRRESTTNPACSRRSRALSGPSAPQGGNMHRNVFFRDLNVPDMPFSALDSQDEEKLWDWMQAQEDAGMTLLAIPHNSNASKGLMFEPIDNRRPAAQRSLCPETQPFRTPDRDDADQGQFGGASPVSGLPTSSRISRTATASPTTAIGPSRSRTLSAGQRSRASRIREASARTPLSSASSAAPTATMERLPM